LKLQETAYIIQIEIAIGIGVDFDNDPDFEPNDRKRRFPVA